MKKIAIDMDDVICDGGYLSLINKFLNTNYTVKDINGYYMQDLVPREKFKQWNEFFKNQNLYDYVEFLPDAYNVIKELNKYYEIYVLTAYVLKDIPEFSGKFLEQKYNWLYKNLPFLDPNKYIFTTNKDIIKCDIKIDDKISNLNGIVETKILFSAYHNQNVKKEELEEQEIIWVNNWKEIKNILI